ncbi:MAG: DMT family transporter [Rhodobacterales bacterium]|nr:DMT family transporter [Rhodobacterales bacterium]
MNRASVLQSGALAGILWMALSTLFAVATGATIKHIGQDVPAAQSAFLRFAFGLPIILPLMWMALPLRLTPQQWRLFGARGALHAMGVMIWYYALTHIPLGEVSALNYLTPVLVAIGATIFLGERVLTSHVLAIVAAVIGTLLILQPGIKVIDSGHIAMIGTAFLLAGGYLIAKRLSATVQPTVIVGMLTIAVSAFLFPFALWFWVPLEPSQYLWFFLAALFATGGQYAVTRAFRAAPVTVTQPASFLQLVWATILGVLLFQEPVDFWVLLGGAVIVSSICLLAWQESRKSPARGGPVAA